jgi:hypothetical protein
MCAERDELHRLVDQLADHEVGDALRLLHRRRDRSTRPWPPRWFAAAPGTPAQPGAGDLSPVVAEGDQAALDWEAAFIAESLTGRSGAPYLPDDLVAALDHAPQAMVEAFLTGLQAHAGQDIPAAELWARWHRLTST